MANAATILARVRSFGANVLSDGGRLTVINREKLPPGAIEFVKKHAREIAAHIDHEADFEERAAIIQYDGGLNRPVAEYLTRLIMAKPPEGTPASDWSWFVGQAAMIIDKAPLRKVAA